MEKKILVNAIQND